MPRKLSVKKERLAELTTDDLTSVAGAAATYNWCATLINCPTNTCTTAMSCGCQPTWNCA